MNSLGYLVSAAEEKTNHATTAPQENCDEIALKNGSKQNNNHKSQPQPRRPSFLLRVILLLLPFLNKSTTKKRKYNPNSSESKKNDDSKNSKVIDEELKEKQKVAYLNAKEQGENTLSPVESPSKRRRSRKSNSSPAGVPSLAKLLRQRDRKILVLDLDETLIHSMSKKAHKTSQIVEVHLKSMPVSSLYYVTKRPYCLEFLRTVSQWFDLAIFTASVQEYADPIIDLLEHDLGIRIFKNRFYRHHCVDDGNGRYIKDLRVLNVDLRRIMLIDNSPVSFTYQKDNGIAVEGWVFDPSDRALMQLLPLLISLRHTTDVRSILCLQSGRLLNFQSSRSSKADRPGRPKSKSKSEHNTIKSHIKSTKEVTTEPPAEEPAATNLAQPSILVSHS